MENDMWTLGYIALIILVNWGFTVVPLVPLFGEMWPPMSLVVGLIFVARDFAQKEIGHKVILAMLVAAGLSYFMASPFVAAASLAAFLISEFADWAIYTWTRKPFAQRILISSVVSTPIDSAVFLAMIGHFSFTGVVIMTLSKMIGALVVWRIVK
jgi:uncharacterized PurR-regulated membrane protein YhhQ (DUF165 family)